MPNFISAAECSIATSLPNGASPPARDPGAQTVAGCKTKPKQNCHVRQHRMLPLATPKPLAIVVPRQPRHPPLFDSGQTMALGPPQASWSKHRRRCFDAAAAAAAAHFRTPVLTGVPCCCQCFPVRSQLGKSLSRCVGARKGTSAPAMNDYLTNGRRGTKCLKGREGESHSGFSAEPVCCWRHGNLP